MHYIQTVTYFPFIYLTIIDPYPPPTYVRLAKANGRDLMFAWEPINYTIFCPSLHYEPVSNCSQCSVTSDSAKCSISVITADAKVCTFAIRTVVCRNIIGPESDTVKVTLKGLNLYL